MSWVNCKLVLEPRYVIIHNVVQLPYFVPRALVIGWSYIIKLPQIVNDVQRLCDK